MVKTAMYFKQITLMLDNQKASQPVWNECDISLLIPNISQTAEESSFIADRMNEIETYVNEMTMKFILGQESLDNFDAFTKNIEKLGINDVLKLKQDAYDRYQQR